MKIRGILHRSYGRDVMLEGAAPRGVDADVLVVGAGPVGLFLSGLLGRAGLRTVLIERRQSSAPPSMAIGIMPPSLMMFEAIGAAAPVVAAGCAVATAVVHDHAGELGRVDFTALPPPFAFILAVSQGELMRILRARACSFPSVCVLDGREAVGVRQDSSSVVLQVRDVRDDTRTELTAPFVAACDGCHSTLRRLLGGVHDGKRYRVSFVMGDFPDTTAWAHDAHLFFTPRGSVESFPLPGHRRRWIALADGPAADTPALVERVRTISGVELDAGAELWHSSFTPERRLARTFSSGRVVLCGDAAHVMSPIGGQGMNTGFGDAWQLAAIMRRLSASHEHHAPLFARYETDRRRAFRIAANRAARGMWLGTRKGRIGSTVRAFVIRRVLLRPPFVLRLPPYFAMLTIPRGRDPLPPQPGGAA
ncbi:MAG TPA: hypothetical protein DCM87_17930 [Planctomycetes bacterium]|nr:hypothetical protein [Planctomycetota bacterium]